LYLRNQGEIKSFSNGTEDQLEEQEEETGEINITTNQVLDNITT
jgi:hypothetical protein